jgi:hypothetical protein
MLARHLIKCLPTFPLAHLVAEEGSSGLIEEQGEPDGRRMMDAEEQSEPDSRVAEQDSRGRMDAEEQATHGMVDAAYVHSLC